MKLDQAHVALRVRGLPDSEIAGLESRENLQMLFFSDGRAIEEAKITDAGLLVLSGLKLDELYLLDLGYCDQITNRGLSYVSRMKSVRRLSLQACKGIRDEGLPHLRKMGRLSELDLRGCDGITDKGLDFLSGMKNLQRIQLGGCSNVSSEKVRQLQSIMPRTRVEKDDREWSYHQ